MLRLQGFLIASGFLDAQATGYFGSLTAAAVRKFQASHGLSQVWRVGPATLSEINNLISGPPHPPSIEGAGSSEDQKKKELEAQIQSLMQMVQSLQAQAGSR